MNLNKINYDDYLKQIGKIETDQKAVIKKYLEEQCQKDEALKSLYRPENLDDCYSFIGNCVRKTACGNSCVEDAIVYKMARDFYLEILPTLTDESEEAKTEIQSEKSTKDDEGQSKTAETAEKLPENENAPTSKSEAENKIEETKADSKIDNLDTFEVFGEDSYVTAETAKKEDITVSENENVTEESTTKYDRDGCGLLFDF